MPKAMIITLRKQPDEQGIVRLHFVLPNKLNVDFRLSPLIMRLLLFVAEYLKKSSANLESEMGLGLPPHLIKTVFDSFGCVPIYSGQDRGFMKRYTIIRYAGSSLTPRGKGQKEYEEEIPLCLCVFPARTQTGTQTGSSPFFSAKG